MTFNWHELDEKDFRKWMLINLITSDRLDGNDNLDALREATNNFSTVELTIQINGIEIPTEYFIKQIKCNMAWWSEKAAEEKVVDEIDKIKDKVADFNNALDDWCNQIISMIKS